ncbi:sugar ABC transporter ATP-binding protein [Rubrobacter calidifluminis]|uniref:sugar ABC transporter ATP-binding protein n=1 Tax=Rubrobacter calidifluminis TaxID=1392640 RepID=UPI00235E37CB|nr:sugar ABC transporter ATP-binding protein [Rubrobacter calidifluminis]
MTEHSHGAPLRLSVEHLSKTFGQYRALSDVHIEVKAGEVHGLVGQNGAGKSTLAKILSGYYAPDPGAEVKVDGERLDLPVPPAELNRRYGVAIVHQSLGLLDELSVIENLRLGRYGRRRFSRRIDWESEKAAVIPVLKRLDCEVDLDAPTGTLPAETRATIAIARALTDHQPGKGLIIFDESTRALSRDALNHFYKLVDSVRAEGVAVLLICHRLEEVLEHTDRVTVLRDGRVAASSLKTRSLSEVELTNHMLGRTLDTTKKLRERRLTSTDTEVPPASPREEGDRGVGLIASRVTNDVVKPLDMEVRPGEVVGLTGLVGSGFDQVPYLLGGARRASGGTITVGNRTIDLVQESNPCRTLLEAGVALVPDDREKFGLMMDQSIRENITLPLVRRKGHRLWVGKDWQYEEVRQMIARLSIKPPEPDITVSSLSGGNQQKVLLGKWLAGNPLVLLLHEPTQAVDVGARQDILGAISEAAGGGCAVVIASTYADELAMIADRVLVFGDGSVTQELTGELSQDEIIEATFVAMRQRSLKT